MDTIYVATWTSEYGDERKAFAKKEDAEKEIRHWIGEYILDVFEDDGTEAAKEFLETIVVRDDEDGTWYQVGKDKEQIYVDEIEFKA